MKKIVSLVLSFVMLLSVTTGMSMTAYAEYDTIGTAKKAEFGVTYSGILDLSWNKNDFYEFYVPEAGNVTFVATLNNSRDPFTYVGIYDVNGEKINSYQGYKNEALGYAKLSVSINLSKGTYYLCMGEYRNNEGEYTVKIDYKLSVTKPSLTKVSTNKKHQITAKWNKVSSCSGYQVQYSKKSNFSSVIATKNVSGKSKTSYTGKNFTKGKKYYVRARAYKTVNGKKYYSSWSKAKSIKCK